VFPVLISILFGFIQFGLILSTKLSLESAASVGARVAVAGADCNEVEEAVLQSLSAAINWDASGNDSVCPIEAIELPAGSGEFAHKVEVVHFLPLMIPFVVPGSQDGFLRLNATSVMR